MKKPLLLVAMLFGVAAFAQNSYTLTTYTSEYSNLIDSTPADLSDEGGEPWDDPNFVIPFGFDFEIGGETYNSAFQIDYGAFMAFGDIANIETDQFQVFGIYDDIADLAEIESQEPSLINYVIDGEPGNKIAKIEYTNAGFYDAINADEPAVENLTNFQLWFYEANGIMEIHFGESNIPDMDLAYFQNSGPTIACGLNYLYNSETVDYGATVKGDPINPSLFEYTDLGATYVQGTNSLNVTPASGRVYRLTPSIETGVDDVNLPEFSIYPTIAKSEIWVKDVKVDNATYRIMDITGKEIHAGKLQTKTSINVSSLRSGLYIISIDGVGNTSKFIKN